MFVCCPPENHSIFTGRNEVVAKVIFLHLLSFCSQGGGGFCLSACWDTTPSPPGAGTPLDQTSPQTRHPPWEQTPPGPGTHPPGPGTPPQEQTPPQTRHPSPPEADSSIRSTSGRYASYWNAFL